MSTTLAAAPAAPTTTPDIAPFPGPFSPGPFSPGPAGGDVAVCGDRGGLGGAGGDVAVCGDRGGLGGGGGGVSNPDSIGPSLGRPGKDIPNCSTTHFSPSSGVPRAPLTPDDSALLDRFLNDDVNLDLNQLARATKRTIADLTAWVALPHIAVLIDAFLHVRRLCEINRDIDKREDALTNLCVVMNQSTNLVEVRRAACAILRAIDSANRSPRTRRPSSGGGGGGGDGGDGGSGGGGRGGGGGSGGSRGGSPPSSASSSSTPTHRAGPSLREGEGGGFAGSILQPTLPIPSTAPASVSALSPKPARAKSPPKGGPCPILHDIIHPPSNSPSALPPPSPRSLRKGFAGLPPATSTPAFLVSASGAAPSRGSPAATSWP